MKISDHFPKISKDSLKLAQRSHGRCRTFSEKFRRLPRINEDCRRLLRKNRRCFDDTPTNLSTIYETNLISVKSSIFSLVRLWKIRHSSHLCGFVSVLRVVYFLLKHSCLYNKYIYYINTSEIPGVLSRVNLIFSHVRITCYFTREINMITIALAT